MIPLHTGTHTYTPVGVADSFGCQGVELLGLCVPTPLYAIGVFLTLWLLIDLTIRVGAWGVGCYMEGSE